ncbi:hypothetical protein RRG08_042650 [Elysia crispata]|uniref:Uncharacterized protein n=1 Tax=Elysia crispata TaxID=231223 RepID=A0AAE0XQ71_9GAST|nr:hypothetical protein RRG08_042650 [Elysia crispata]
MLLFRALRWLYSTSQQSTAPLILIYGSRLSLFRCATFSSFYQGIIGPGFSHRAAHNWVQITVDYFGLHKGDPSLQDRRSL